MSKPSKDQNSWYQPKWSREDDKSDSDNKRAGAIASKVTRTDSYIKSSRRNLIENHQEVIKELADNFPFFQEIKGDGFCALHASIVGILAKCVNDVESFEKFKNNLEKWKGELKGYNKEEVKEAVDKILEKLQKKNLTYQDFYKLTAETNGKDNLVNKLSVLLFTNTSFEANPKTKYPGSPDDQEQQRKYLSDPETMDKQSGLDMNSVMKMLMPIFPFPIKNGCHPVTWVDKDNVDMELSKNTIYLFHDGQHFDLLHSKLDNNLAEAIKVEERIIESQRSEALKRAKDSAEKEKTYVAPKKSADLNQQIVKKDLAPKKPIVQTQQAVRQNPALEKQVILDQQDASATKPKLQQQANLQDSQRTTLERLKTEFKAKDLAFPSFKESETFSRVTQKESDLAKRLEQQYGSKPNSKTTHLIKKEVENQDKVFVNKFVRALNRLRNIIQDSKLDFKEEEIWGNLTTLDKRVLIDYHNKNNEGSELVKFEPLAKDDLKKVLSSAVQEIPESSISGTEAKRLYKNIINETAR
jgi:hypothetical protein